MKFEGSLSSGSARDVIYERIAKDSEIRAQAQRDYMNMKLFLLQPESESSQAFSALKKEEALIEACIQLLQKQTQLQELTAEANIPAAGNIPNAAPAAEGIDSNATA